MGSPRCRVQHLRRLQWLARHRAQRELHRAERRGRARSRIGLLPAPGPGGLRPLDGTWKWAGNVLEVGNVWKCGNVEWILLKTNLANPEVDGVWVKHPKMGRAWKLMLIWDGFIESDSLIKSSSEVLVGNSWITTYNMGWETNEDWGYDYNGIQNCEIETAYFRKSATGARWPWDGNRNSSSSRCWDSETGSSLPSLGEICKKPSQLASGNQTWQWEIPCR